MTAVPDTPLLRMTAVYHERAITCATHHARITELFQEQRKTADSLLRVPGGQGSQGYISVVILIVIDLALPDSHNLLVAHGHEWREESRGV